MASAQEVFSKRLADAERRRNERGLDKVPLDGGGNGPHPPDMEQRVAKLETDVGEIKATLARLEPILTRIDAGVRKLEADVGELKGRMTGIEGQLRQIPTMWTLTTLVLSIFGLAFALLKFAAPH